MGDFSEFREHWRPLLAAFIGMGSALSLNSYILSTFAPYLIGEFGWSRAQWAMLGIAQILIMFCLPVAGRLTDIFGVRRVAAVGALSFPVFLVAITAMNGDIHVYLAIYIAQTVICSTTTATVYSRLVATAFNVRRGLALAIFGSSPPIFGALGAPLITGFVAIHGWRAGLLGIAIFCLISAIATLLLIPAGTARNRSADGGRKPQGDYRAIFTTRAFWILLAAIFLVNMPFTLAVSQLKLVVLEQGLTDSTAAMLVSVFAISSVAGRALSGATLDYLPAHIVAAIGFFLPFAGLLLLASPLDSLAAVTIALLLIGISFGSEGDIVPYLVTRLFRPEVYSTVLGLLSAAMGAAMASGNAILGFTLDSTGSFDFYLYCAAAGSLAGSAMFLTLGQRRRRRTSPAGA